MDISLQKEIEQVRIVEANRSYWFIRSYGGELYDYFLDNNFVGLGFNQIPYQYIKEAKWNDEATYNRLQTYISNSTEYKKGEATKWANQLISFDKEIKLDDIVIVPSRASDYLAVGIVESETYVTKVQHTFKFGDKLEPYPEKRRKIKWLKQIPKDDFRGELKGMFASHSAVSNANRFSEIIEGNLSTLYIKNEHIYLTIKIDQDEEINAFELQRFLEGLTYLYKELCIDHGVEENEELYIKIKVQSKGGMFLKALGYGALISIAGIIALSDNSKVKIELGNWGKLEGESVGFLKSWTNFLDANEVRDEHKAEAAQKRKMELLKFTESIEKLKAKPVNNSISKEQDKVDEPEK